MPVTAKLSRKFYDQFGDEVVAELVELLNQVDADSHPSLRELNELNFARFDAKMGERMAMVDTRLAMMDTRLVELRRDLEKTMAEGFAGMDRRFAAIDSRFADIDVRFAHIDVRFAAVGTTMADAFAASERRMLRWFLALWFAQTLIFLTVWLGAR